MRTALELEGGEARFVLLGVDVEERAAARDLWFGEDGARFSPHARVSVYRGFLPPEADDDR